MRLPMAERRHIPPSKETGKRGYEAWPTASAILSPLDHDVTVDHADVSVLFTATSLRSQQTSSEHEEWLDSRPDNRQWKREVMKTWIIERSRLHAIIVGPDTR